MAQKGFVCKHQYNACIIPMVKSQETKPALTKVKEGKVGGGKKSPNEKLEKSFFDSLKIQQNSVFPAFCPKTIVVQQHMTWLHRCTT